MSKRRKHSLKRPRSKKALNQVPGTITYIGRKKIEETELEVIEYNSDSFKRFSSHSPEDAFHHERRDKVIWVNINGLNNIPPIEKLGKFYNLHPLLREDISNTNQRPKIEEFEDHVFLVIKMLHYREDGLLLNEHLSVVMSQDYLLTFQEADGDVFGPVRERIENSKGRIRNKGTDFLLFSLLDAVIDSYFLVTDKISDKIENLEEQLFTEQPSDDITFEIQELKREILRVRRTILPMREVMARLEKIDGNLIDGDTVKYLHDLHDHIIQVSDNIELYREMSWSLMDMYMTTLSHKMNEVMKVLTIMASIFIPLTFIVGVYGMNFEYMPELQWRYGYFLLLGIMFLLFVGMLFYFKTKKWL